VIVQVNASEMRGLVIPSHIALAALNFARKNDACVI